MKFYYFGGMLNINNTSHIDYLEKVGFDGVLLTYHPYDGDFFIKVARTLKLDQKIKYLVAVRTHTISPQFLCTINKSIKEIQDNRLEINFISGKIEESELNFNGILGNVTDHSSIKDRTEHMMEYIEELSDMRKDKNIYIPDYYVSCTNIHSYNKTTELDQKIILPYWNYKHKFFVEKDEFENKTRGKDLLITNQKLMISIAPIIRETQEEIDAEFPKNKYNTRFDFDEPYLDRQRDYKDAEFFTYEEFVSFIETIKSDGVHGLLISAMQNEQFNLIKYIKKYKNQELICI
jgi:hypothetical protein